MKILLKSSLVISLVAVVLGTAVTLSRAEPQCSVLSSVQWWEDTDHQKMIRYVDVRHGGDWDSYLAKWQSHLTSVRGVYNRGGAVTSKKLGITIKGETLYRYIAAVEERVSVTRCLARQEMIRAARKLEDMETASGDSNLLPETVR